MVVTATDLPYRTLRDAARITGKLGLECPAPRNAPALTVIPPADRGDSATRRYNAFHHLDYKFGEYVKLWRTGLPVEDPARLYHPVECTDLSCAGHVLRGRS